MPRKILLVIKSSPYVNLMATEGFRIATAMIAMDVLPQLLLIDDGVRCLMKDQRPEAIGLTSHYERLKTIADLVGLYALRDSVVNRNLKTIEFDESLNVKLLSTDEAAKLFMENEAVIAL